MSDTASSEDVTEGDGYAPYDRNDQPGGGDVSPEAEDPGRRPTAEELLANARPTRVLPYSDRKNEHKLQRRVEEHDLRKKVAQWSYIGLAAQILVADSVFAAYAWSGRGWDVPVAAISVWLSATVVQVVAVLLVITRYLFPDRGKRS